MGSFSVARPTVQPIEQPDVLSNFAKLQQLQGMKQQQQIQAQQAPYQQQILQEEAAQAPIKTQEMQQQQKDMQAANRALQSWNGQNIEELPSLYIKNGASANAVIGLKKTIIDQKAKYSQIAKDDSETGKNTLQALGQRNGMLASNIAALEQIPDAQLGPEITKRSQDLIQQGLLDPQHAQLAQQLAQLPPQQARAGLENMRKSLLSDDQLRQEAQQAEAARHNKAMEEATAASQANTQAYQRARIGIEAGNLSLNRQKAMLDQNASTATGDEFLQTLSPGAQAQVKAMANGDIAIPPPGTRNPQAQQLRTAVLSYDPTYTDARYKGKQDFKNKGDAQNIVQLATAMEHSDRALANSAKMGFAPLAGNKTLEAPESAAYMQDAEFLTGEVGKLVKNGVLTVDESNKIQSGMTSARQSVRDAALHETMDLLGGKARAVFQKYKTGTGQDLPVNQFFDPHTQQNLVKYGIVDSSAPSGGQSQAGNATPAPQTHLFSASAWLRANPKGDVNAAIAAAKQQNYQVTQ